VSAWWKVEVDGWTVFTFNASLPDAVQAAFAYLPYDAVRRETTFIGVTPALGPPGARSRVSPEESRRAQRVFIEEATYQEGLSRDEAVARFHESLRALPRPPAGIGKGGVTEAPPGWLLCPLCKRWAVERALYPSSGNHDCRCPARPARPDE
jgi:hypothetical protein